MAGDWSRKQLMKLLAMIKEVSPIMYNYKHIKKPDGSESVEREIILLAKELGFKNFDEQINKKIEEDVLGDWREGISELIWKLAHHLLSAEGKIKSEETPSDDDMPETWIDRIVAAEEVLVRHNVLSLYPIEIRTDLVTEENIDFGTKKEAMQDEENEPYQDSVEETHQA